MELKDFVKQSLIEIAEGIKEAGASGVKVSGGSTRLVEFDVSVTTSSVEGAKVGGGIFVSAIRLGGERTDQESNSAVSRLKFGVHIFHDNEYSLL